MMVTGGHIRRYLEWTIGENTKKGLNVGDYYWTYISQMLDWLATQIIAVLLGWNREF